MTRPSPRRSRPCRDTIRSASNACAGYMPAAASSSRSVPIFGPAWDSSVAARGPPLSAIPKPSQRGCVNTPTWGSTRSSARAIRISKRRTASPSFCFRTCRSITAPGNRNRAEPGRRDCRGARSTARPCTTDSGRDPEVPSGRADPEGGERRSGKIAIFGHQRAGSDTAAPEFQFAGQWRPSCAPPPDCCPCPTGRWPGRPPH